MFIHFIYALLQWKKKRMRRLVSYVYKLNHNIYCNACVQIKEKAQKDEGSFKVMRVL